MAWDDVLPCRLFGGFEASTMRMPDGRRVDSLAGTRHDALYERDYDLLLQAGIRGVRESLRWHHMQPSASDFLADELLARLRGLRGRGMQAIWSLTQFGLPDWVDIWAPSFPSQFEHYARRVAELYQCECEDVPIWAPINEISYWAWAGGNVGGFAPATVDRGGELKLQLTAAAIAACRALREVDPRCRLVHVDPVINIVSHCDEPSSAEEEGSYEAWDMLRGTLHPELGGRPEFLDIVGVNFYPHNQRLADGTMIPPHDPQFVPVHRLIEGVARRYGRPLLIAETGTEGHECADWLRYMAAEIQRAASRMTVVGLCLYPVLDYPGWADGRHCTCGLIGSDAEWSERWLHPYMREALAETFELLAGEATAGAVPD
jgi:hypothetical protein